MSKSMLARRLSLNNRSKSQRLCICWLHTPEEIWEPEACHTCRVLDTYYCTRWLIVAKMVCDIHCGRASHKPQSGQISQLQRTVASLKWLARCLEAANGWIYGQCILTALISCHKWPIITISADAVKHSMLQGCKKLELLSTLRTD